MGSGSIDTIKGIGDRNQPESKASQLNVGINLTMMIFKESEKIIP